MTRSAAEIAAGLAPARRSQRIRAGERVHVVGAAGAGASAAALLAHHAGAIVSACDKGGPSPYTTALEAAGIAVADGHDATHVLDGAGNVADRLAVTKALTAVEPDHPELGAARRLGLPVEPWQQLIADAAATHGGRLVAVAGTHGKSTTSGWLVHLLTVAGRDPAAFVGALLPADLTGGVAATARWGSGDVFVVEADEYAGNFDPYRPALAVVLNVEWDHPDVFEDDNAVLDAFARWIEAPGAHERTVVWNAGDPGARKLVDRLERWTGDLAAFALVASPEDAGVPRRTAAPAHGRDDGRRGAMPSVVGRILRLDAAGTELEIDVAGGDSLTVRLRLPGRHVVEDALAVASVALRLGVRHEAIVRGLETFGGVGRRLELKADVAGVVVLDDYGHHPTAIAATMRAVRQRYPGRRLWAVYEPLTYHRTAAMLDAFADVLAEADVVAIADIWAGRDPDTSITSARALAAAVTARGRALAVAPGSVESTGDHLASAVVPGDVVLVMGGGRSYVIAERLVALLEGREATAR